MIQKIKVGLGLQAVEAVIYQPRPMVYRPERPINFVRRSDPSFYFLSKR